ncbi:hypothetical protein QR98_0027480 [Sarcoptes scabiei]|nr:hypothetical protein QR98_0027480 [Sarcoptes scabiei]
MRPNNIFNISILSMMMMMILIANFDQTIAAKKKKNIIYIGGGGGDCGDDHDDSFSYQSAFVPLPMMYPMAMGGFGSYGYGR